MKKKLIAIACLSLATLGITTTTTATAAKSIFHGQRCELGATCTIPGDDGGITYFSIAPKNGTTYQCTIHSNEGGLRVNVTDGKDFHIIDGEDVYTANPDVGINISGRFENPNNPDEDGQIKFIKISGNEGTVTCTASS